MTEALRIIGLSRTFGTTTVLAGVDLALERGDRLAVVGASGSGKTTLLRLIAGLDVPTAGEVVLDGRPASRGGRLLLPPQRRGVAMVFQGLALFPHLRALDQVAFAAKGRGGRARAAELLDRIGLGHRAAAPLDQLSGGERQRVALARALAQEPSLILMDEPFASLDDDRRAEMRGLLRSLLDGSDATLVLVTHSRDDALDLARQVLVLDRGRPVASDTLAGVLADPRHAAAVRCLGLGELLDGDTTDGPTASTPFGTVELDRPVPAGRVRLLVRPGQPRVSVDGIEADVVAVELRPAATAGVRRVAVVRVGEHLLRVDVGDGLVEVGQRLRIGIRGACVPVDF
jgi:iron(III) transport system ATP-binding protein